MTVPLAPLISSDLAEGGGAAGEFALPEGVADDGDGRGGRAVVVFGEDAADAGGDAEHLEVVAGDDGAA